ncbi:hypothetical protein [Saccharothrix xinjiangensis]|uniref:PadR family transcriptional regulator n=1 Tax=Saccharothrix xinjiangensis TaxID=204798 RepID=A0ABV9YA15_9PSEU
MDLSPAEPTVLGLLVERPGHGHDIERVVEERGVRQLDEFGPRRCAP